MDHLSNALDPRTRKSYHPAIRRAMDLARKKLDRYYSLTDSSAVYWIAMVLHPGMKLEYFRQHEWKEEWIEQAENMVREEYISLYEKTSDENLSLETNTTNNTKKVWTTTLYIAVTDMSVGYQARLCFFW
jgi:hypothetical protein